eukprot:894715_1
MKILCQFIILLIYCSFLNILKAENNINAVKQRFQPNDLNALVNNMNNPNLKIDSKDIIEAPNWNKISMQGFWTSFAMIIVSEIGDKTFFIAAILAMKHNRFMVWCGGASALFIMTLMAVAFGSILLKLIPQEITHYGAGILFFGFAIKLLWEGNNMKGGEASDELREVEEELRHQERQNSAKIKTTKKRKNLATDIELGGITKQQNNVSINDNNDKIKKRDSSWNLSILIRSFVMTFISEIGDRSQITTIVLAAHKSPYGVVIGASLGHAICTAIAVLGGKLLASRISEKNVTLIGGFLFLIFAVETFIIGPL